MEMTVEDKIRNGDYLNKIPYSKETRAAYRDETQRLVNQLRIDIEIEYEMTGHAKAQDLWRIAWNMGHSSGYNDVLNYYDEMSILITK